MGKRGTKQDASHSQHTSVTGISRVSAPMYASASCPEASPGLQYLSTRLFKLPLLVIQLCLPCLTQLLVLLLNCHLCAGHCQQQHQEGSGCRVCMALSCRYIWLCCPALPQVGVLSSLSRTAAMLVVGAHTYTQAQPSEQSSGLSGGSAAGTLNKCATHTQTSAVFVWPACMPSTQGCMQEHVHAQLLRLARGCNRAARTRSCLRAP